MPTQAITYDPNKDTELEFKLLNHNVVMFYRAWTLAPGSKNWTQVAEGDTDDTKADKWSLGKVAKGTQVAMTLSIGSTNPDSFKLEVDILRDGKSVGASGTFFVQDKLEKGSTGMWRKVINLEGVFV